MRADDEITSRYETVMEMTSTHVYEAPLRSRVRTRPPYPYKETTMSEDTERHLVAGDVGSPEVSTISFTNHILI